VLAAPGADSAKGDNKQPSRLAWFSPRTAVKCGPRSPVGRFSRERQPPFGCSALHAATESPAALVLALTVPAALHTGNSLPEA
jgi:hypothetical protein